MPLRRYKTNIFVFQTCHVCHDDFAWLNTQMMSAEADPCFHKMCFNCAKIWFSKEDIGCVTSPTNRNFFLGQNQQLNKNKFQI